MVHKQRYSMKFATEEESIASHLLNDFPPINVNVIDSWVRKAKDKNLKEALKQWKQVVEGRRGLINLDLYDKVQKKFGYTTR